MEPGEESPGPSPSTVLCPPTELAHTKAEHEAAHDTRAVAALTTLTEPAVANEASEADTETEARTDWVWIWSSARPENEAGARVKAGAIMLGLSGLDGVVWVGSG